MSEIRLSYLLPVLLIALTLSPLAAGANDETTHYDRISLQATASSEVENDILEAVLSVHREGSNPALLSEEVNRDIRWAIEVAKPFTTVRVQTLGYRTRPIYRQQLLSGWRVRQDLRLEGRDATALSRLIGKLQERLALGQVGYRISEKRRDEAEERLISEAIARFQQRAALVTKQMGRRNYRVVSMNINTRGASPRPMARAEMAMTADARTPPSLEAGVQTLQVSISGVIELQLD